MNPRIRLAQVQDASSIIEIYGPIIQNSTTSFELDIPGKEEMAGRIQHTLTNFPWLVMTYDQDIMGYAYAGAHRSRRAYRWSTELSVYVHPNYYRRQVGSRLYSSLMAILTLQGYRNFLAGVTLPNDRSIQFHQSIGFTPIGTYRKVGYKFGSWHDVTWMELAVSGEDPPSEPLSLSAATQLADWHSALTSGLKA